jgi:hypothetical protein
VLQALLWDTPSYSRSSCLNSNRNRSLSPIFPNNTELYCRFFCGTVQPTTAVVSTAAGARIFPSVVLQVVLWDTSSYSRSSCLNSSRNHSVSPMFPRNAELCYRLFCGQVQPITTTVVSTAAGARTFPSVVLQVVLWASPAHNNNSCLNSSRSPYIPFSCVTCCSVEQSSPQQFSQQ